MDRIKPLDLIFFKGTDFISDTIGLVEKISSGSGEFTHVGVVINKELLPLKELEDKKLYILESTSYTYADSVDIVRKKQVCGVQIRELESVITTYKKYDKDAIIAHAELIDNPFITDKDNTITKFKNVYEKYSTTFYDMNPFSLFGAAFKCCRKYRSALENIVIEKHKIIKTKNNMNEWVFCSELVGIVYKELNILDTHVEPKDIMPMDFLKNDIDNIKVVVKQPIVL